MNTTTRISDLPENITMQISNNNNMQQNMMINGGGEKKFDPNINTNYVPINVHPNPYGISEQNPIMPLPQHQQPPNVQQMQQMQQLEQLSVGQQQQMQQQQMQMQQQQMQQQQGLTEQQQYELQQLKQVRLPSRDIPITTNNYMQDEQIQPNYIPKPKLTSDYIHDFEETTEKNIKKHEEKKHRESRIDELLSELQTPILLIVLYFIFQMPIINTMIFKKFSFLSIYTLDGNFNFYGLLFKSMMFGGLFYTVQKIMKFISEF